MSPTNGASPYKRPVPLTHECRMPFTVSAIWVRVQGPPTLKTHGLVGISLRSSFSVKRLLTCGSTVGTWDIGMAEMTVSEDCLVRLCVVAHFDTQDVVESCPFGWQCANGLDTGLYRRCSPRRPNAWHQDRSHSGRSHTGYVGCRVEGEYTTIVIARIAR